MLDHAPSAPAALLRLRPTVSAAVLDEGAVLLDLESKYFYALNASAWAIAQLFEAGTSVDGAVASARTWGAADGEEIVAFANRLQSYNLLEAASIPDGEADVTLSSAWSPPTIEQQAEPLQTVMVSAFDPSIPLAE